MCFFLIQYNYYKSNSDNSSALKSAEAILL